MSAYYPQARPLVEKDAVEFAEKARYKALDLAKQCVADGVFPWMPGYVRADVPRDRVHCTMDFVVTGTGDVIFLEAGPAHFAHWGAHPCCFEGRVVAGLALQSESGAVRSKDQPRKGDPDCEHCHGAGERFWHSDDCRSEDCTLNGDLDSCQGQVEPCACLQPKDRANARK